MKIDEIKGASKSLKRTISDLSNYMDSDESHSPSELRAKMYEAIGDIAAWWLEEGFRLGHKESYRAFRDDGEIPATLRIEYGDAWLSPSCERTVQLTSRTRRT